MTVIKFFKPKKKVQKKSVNRQPKHIKIGVYANINLSNIISSRNYTIYIHKLDRFPSFDEFDIIIYYGSSLYNEYIDSGFRVEISTQNMTINEQESIRREKEIVSNFKEGKIICFIYNSIDGDILINSLIEEFGLKYKEFNKAIPLHSIEVKIKHFNEFFEKYSTGKSFFLNGEYFNDHLIISKDENYVYSFMIENLNNGKMIFIPSHLTSENSEFIKEYFSTLGEALYNLYSENLFNLPEYLNEILFPNEIESIKKKIQYEEKIKELEPELNKYLKLKSILYLDGNNLVSNIVFFLDNLGLNIYRDEKNIEDIWVTENDKKIVIVEIKGLAKNIKREHIRQLERHREYYFNKDDTFPALLILNTFKNEQDFNKKNTNISPFEIQYAVKNNVLIMRTLDLLNINLLIEKNLLNKDEFLNILKTKRGWLKVTEKKYEIIEK